MNKYGLFLIGLLLSGSALAEGSLRCGSSVISVGAGHR